MLLYNDRFLDPLQDLDDVPWFGIGKALDGKAALLAALDLLYQVFVMPECVDGTCDVQISNGPKRRRNQTDLRESQSCHAGHERDSPS